MVEVAYGDTLGGDRGVIVIAQAEETDSSLAASAGKTPLANMMPQAENDGNPPGRWLERGHLGYSWGSLGAGYCCLFAVWYLIPGSAFWWLTMHLLPKFKRALNHYLYEIGREIYISHNLVGISWASCL